MQMTLTNIPPYEPPLQGSPVQYREYTQVWLINIACGANGNCTTLTKALWLFYKLFKNTTDCTMCDEVHF